MTSGSTRMTVIPWFRPTMVVQTFPTMEVKPGPRSTTNRLQKSMASILTIDSRIGFTQLSKTTAHILCRARQKVVKETSTGGLVRVVRLAQSFRIRPTPTSFMALAKVNLQFKIGKQVSLSRTG